MSIAGPVDALPTRETGIVSGLAPGGPGCERIAGLEYLRRG